jgi:hypothetical protein
VKRFRGLLRRREEFVHNGGQFTFGMVLEKPADVRAARAAAGNAQSYFPGH